MIAAFVGYAGIAESRQVSVMEKVRGLTVGDVMIHSDRVLPMDTPLDEIARQWKRTSQSTLPVVSIVGTVVGTLRLDDVTKALAEGKDPSTMAGQLIDFGTSVDVLRPNEQLSVALSKVGKLSRQVPVVDETGHLIGMLDLDTMLSRRGLPRLVEPSPHQPVQQFDATT